MAKVTSLGYLGIGVSDLDAWKAYATGVLGIEAIEQGSRLDLRYDEQIWRLSLAASGEDDLTFIGLEVSSVEALEALQETLKEKGISAEPGSKALCAERGVDALVCCEDPFGLAVELYVGERLADDPFQPAREHAGFVTGDMGLGHIVLSAPDEAAATGFFMEALGFNLSDHVLLGPEGRQLRLTFMHCNPRHHSLAIAPVPAPKRLNHIMMEAATMDEVGRTLDIVQRSNVPVSSSLGKHTNDMMVSFYMQTPSGFDIEYGCEGLAITDDWTPSVHYAPSLWGHRGALNP